MKHHVAGGSLVFGASIVQDFEPIKIGLVFQVNTLIGDTNTDTFHMPPADHMVLDLSFFRILEVK